VIATNEKEEERLAELACHCEYEIVPFQRVGTDWLKRKLPFIKATSVFFFLCLAFLIPIDIFKRSKTRQRKRELFSATILNS
jgi:hypothetical protein